MIDTFDAASPATRAALAVASDAALKAAALFILALAAHAALGRRRVLARSALWNACLAGLLLLPAASLAFPRWRIAIASPREVALAARSASARSVPLPQVAPVLETLSVPSGPITVPPAETIGAPPAIEPAPVHLAPGPIVPPRPAARPSLAALVLSAYLAGAAVLVLKLAASLAAIHRLRRRCEPIAEPGWLAALGRWRTWVGVDRRVVLLASDRVSVPIAVGWLRPAIILPPSLAVTADPGLVDAVLLHELSHVRRGDFGWNLVRKLVQVLYWPHPLIWPLGRIVRAVREQACDDLCVHALGGAPAYRTALLEVAAGLVRRPDPALGLAMARPTHLGRRLAWIDRSRGVSRCLLRRPARLALAAMVLALAGLLGSIEPARATSRAAEGRDDPQAQPADTPKPTAEKADPDGPKAVELTVRAKDTGRPLAGARIRAYLDFQFEHLRTSKEGKARIDRTHRTFGDTLSIDVWAEGYVQQRHFFAQHDARYPKISPQVTIELLPGEQTLGGQVVDEAGRPIAGVKVEIWGYLGEKKESHELAFMVDATTDDQGRWRCRCFRNMQFAYLYLSHPDYLADGERHPRQHGRPRPSDPPQPDERPMEPLRNFSDVQVMTRGVEVAGKVTDRRGRPVAGAEVGWLEADQREAVFHSELPTTRTDAAGRFRFPHARPGRLVLQVKARGHAPELKPIAAKAGMGPIALELGPPRTLTGRVVDSRGRPIPDAFINIDTWRGSRALGVFLKSGADGRFRWDDAPPDPVLLNASHAGYEYVFQQSASPDGGEAILMLKRTLAISGRIRDAATNKPIERAEVEVGIPDAKTGAISWGADLRCFSFQGRLQADLDAEKSPEFRLRIKAKGYEPFESRTFRSDEGQVEYDVKLTKTDKPQGAVLTGVVHRPDGRPLAGAEVAVTYPMTGGLRRLPTVQIENGKIRSNEGQTVVKTDTQGRFTLTRQPDPAGKDFAVVVAHPEFYAEVDRRAFEASSAITARPWGRVEGFARIGSRPAAGATIRYFGDRLGNRDVPYVFDSGQTKADDRGHFILERVVPGDVRVALGYGEGRNLRAWSNGELVAVQPGEVAQVKLGGRGRPVVARIVPPPGFDPNADYTAYSEFEIQSDRPIIPYPKEVLAKHDESMTIWAKRWHASAEGRAYRRNWFRLGQAKLQPDGTIRAEDVPPGEYRLNLTYSADPIYGLGRSPERFAYATKQFTIPEIPGGRSDEPFDLGVLRPKPKQTLKVGQAAPAFEVATLDGRRLKLEDFRGKYLLLDFWATWCGPCVAEIPELKTVHDRFGADERFAMLSLSLDADKEAPRKFVAEKGLRWAQGFLGEWVEGGVQDAYHVEAIPAVFLIGPDGRLKAQGLRGETIGAAVANALSRP